MGHKSSQAGSDSEDSELRMPMKNRRKKKRNSSKISPDGGLQMDELRKQNNGNSPQGREAENDCRRNQNKNRISSGGGGLEEDDRRNRYYKKTIPEESELENEDRGRDTVVVLQLGLNSPRDASDIKGWIQSFGGIESVDGDSNKLTVTGEVDEQTLRELVEQMVSKKAQSISPPSKICHNGDVHGAGKTDKACLETQQNPHQSNPKESPVPTAVLMVDLHCQGCIRKICKAIKKTKGYYDMSIDRPRNAVTVKGTMDVKTLADRLSKKLNNRTVLIAPPGDGEGGEQASALSPSPENDMVGRATKTGKETEPQKELDGNKSNKPPVTTTVLKIDLPCGCIGHSNCIRTVFDNTRGCQSYDISTDESGKTVVNLTGTVDVKGLKEKLEKKLKKPVEIITPPPPIFDDGGSESEDEDGRKESRSAGDNGGTTQYTATGYPDPYMYGHYWDYSFSP